MEHWGLLLLVAWMLGAFAWCYALDMEEVAFQPLAVFIAVLGTVTFPLSAPFINFAARRLPKHR